MKVFATCKLTHTLQTYLGMVSYGGEPMQRLYHTMPRYLVDSEEAVVKKNSPYWHSDEERVFLFTMCVPESRLPRFRSPGVEDDTLRMQFNIAACCNLWIDVNFMKEKIMSLQRLDLEQAAAIVISAIRNDATLAARGKIVESLIKELDETMLVKSYSIILSRKKFRSLHRRLLRYFRFWDPQIRLRNAIKDLEKDVIYGAQHIKADVLPCQDTVVVAHYFLALQRRLQLKAVSDLAGGGFLETGESGNILQKDPEIPTTFEERLAAFGGPEWCSCHWTLPTSDGPVLPSDGGIC
ncbi:hypothetical protein OEA41_008038 [Lepraria neglecta]|uniref:Uncharacterized protein n=1 Tax=Lepraria neglecta TaxID=209136 RepID=A0AAE0DNI4_9LECA|nr:hypothetical protein OEA41_008038 [Lepraria neglecta]